MSPEPEGVFRFKVLRRWRDRLRGLLGTGEDAEPVVLLGCSSVHTFGMRYALDIAFATHDGFVLWARRSVPPGRIVGCRHAYYAFERPASPLPWMQVGGRVVRDGASKEAGTSADERSS